MGIDFSVQYLIAADGVHSGINPLELSLLYMYIFVY